MYERKIIFMDKTDVGKKFNVEVTVGGEIVKKNFDTNRNREKKFISPKKRKGGTLYSSKGIIRSI